MKRKEKLIVGYLQSWSNITFTQAAKSGYTAIVMGFGTITEDEIGIYDGAFQASPTDEALINDIKNAKSNGAKEILFSVGGGENNTYNPGSTSPLLVATSLVNYLDKYGFTGVDFDLEINTDEIYLDNLCLAIKNLDSNLIITGAPQLNQNEHESDLYCVSTESYKVYDLAIKNKRFDYLFIQAYNNQWPKINDNTQENVEFISSSFKNLKNNIPQETLIVIGEPANKNAAGFCIYNNSTKEDDIYKDIANEYLLISNDSQFGGAMTWSINQDEENKYLFVNSLTF